DLELRDRLAGAAHLRALARDRRQLLDRLVELLRVGLRFADAHVERDLRQLRNLHDRAKAQLLPELRTELVLVVVLEARRIAVSVRAHQRSISWPQSARLQ